MKISIFAFIAVSLLSGLSYAQDASTSEGQLSILHRNRLFAGTPIKKFSAKIIALKAPGQLFSTTMPVAYDGKVYIGTDSGIVYLATPTELKPLSKLEGAGAITGAPAISNDTIVVGFKNNLVAAFSRTDGSLFWKFETKGPVVTTPLIKNNNVYASSASGHVYALRADNGSFKWRFTAISNPSSPAYDKDMLFVGNDRGRLYAIDTKDGFKSGYEIWSQNWAGGTPLINGPDIYAVALRGSVYEIDLTTGHSVADTRSFLKMDACELACGSNIMVVRTTSGLVAYDSRVGEGGKWEKNFPKPISGFPIIVGDVVYAACLDGNLYALDLQTGTEYSHLDLGFIPIASPAFCNNQIVIANQDQVFFMSGE
ncbi:MAG: PQQ-binding-like beta-propeller repeat protein [bacterium]